MFIVKYYVLGALLALMVAIFSPYIYFQFIFAWIALSLGGVSAAYLLQEPRIFRKKINGSIPFYIKWIFVPFLLGAQLYNAWKRKNDRVPAIQKIRDNLFLACRLFPSDVETLKQLNVHAILDVTAEFDGLDWTAESEELDYLNIPVLDHQSPSEKDLVEAVTWIRNHIGSDRGVVVHCALGRGRSVLVMAAYLLSLDEEMSVEEAVAEINQTRSTARLNPYQLKKLSKIRDSNALRTKHALAVVANPVAGGGKWQEYSDEIIQRLSSYYDLKVYETSKDIDGKQRAQQAIDDGAKYIVACGGDGTIAEVASQLVETDITLGVMPMGTANSLSHVLYGVESKLIPIDVACDAIISRQTVTIDTAMCNQEVLLLVVGIGFEQQMIEQADRAQKDQGGQMAYLEALFDAVSNNQTSELTIYIDDQDAQVVETGSLIIANAAPSTTVLAQGGGEPDFTDGKLDITWLSKAESASESLVKMANLAIRSLQEAGDLEDITHVRAKQIRVVGNGTLKYVIDGENRQADEITVSMKPASLRVFCTTE